VTILCGTDFSDAAKAACDTAAALATALGEELVLAHVFDFPGAEAYLDLAGRPPEGATERFYAGELARLGKQLDAEAGRLRGQGVAVESRLTAGASDERLLGLAVEARAALIVVGSLGRRAGGLWRLGSTADRVAQAATVPVLVVRTGKGLREWGANGRELVVLVAYEPSESSDAALKFVPRLESAGPCRVVCAHVHWAPKADPAVEPALRSRLEGVRRGAPFELCVLAGLGRPADHLAQIAKQEKADLVVVGSNQRHGLDRIWHGSISHGVIERSPASVLCVPMPRA